MSRKQFVYDGMSFPNKTFAAIHIMETKKVSASEAARQIGISPQTIYAYTNGKDNRSAWLKKEQVKRLHNGGRRIDYIAKKTGMSEDEINKIISGKQSKDKSLISVKKRKTKAIKQDEKLLEHLGYNDIFQDIEPTEIFEDL